MSGDDFYVRYYVGHKGKFGHEFLEFEFRPDGKVRSRGGGGRPPRGASAGRPFDTSPCPLPQLRYANNSNYKNDTMIRKECFVSQAVLDELKRIIEDSEVRAVVARRRSSWCGVRGSGSRQRPLRRRHRRPLPACVLACSRS